MRRDGNKPASDWRDGFLFLGNETVLDFLNTRPLQDGAFVELLPDFRALLRWFRAAGLLGPRQAAVLERRWGRSERARRLVQTLQALRETLRKEIVAWERGRAVRPAMVASLNRLLAEHPMRARLAARSGGHATELYFQPRRPEDLLAPLAHSAAMLFADVDRKRVRKCRQCVLHFHDTSKKGTRRWCSMRLCGNRRKVAAYAARRRRAAAG